MMGGVEVGAWGLHPHGSGRLESRSGSEGLLMHLTNSRPSLGLCMTGRGELTGNEGEEEVEVVGEVEKQCSPQDGERSSKAGTG